MRVKVKFFALCRELTGKDEEKFQLKNGATLRDLQKLVVSAHPALKGLKNTILVSLNEALAEEGIMLKEFDEAAFFPPVSGG